MKNKPIFLVVVATKKNIVVNTEVQTGSCVKYSILGDYWIYFSCILSGYLKIIINTKFLQYLPKLPQQQDKKTKYGNENLQRAS